MPAFLLVLKAVRSLQIPSMPLNCLKKIQLNTFKNLIGFM